MLKILAKILNPMSLQMLFAASSHEMNERAYPVTELK